MNRNLYLIAYDIRNGRRLSSLRHFLKGYSTGGQKSVYECFLTDAEYRCILRAVRDLIEEKEDRVHIFKLDGRSKPHTLGIGIEPVDPAFFYIG